MNKIYIFGETYSDIVRQKFNLYSALSFSLFKYYICTRRGEWEEDKYFTAKKVRSMSLNKYNSLFISGGWYNKYPKDS